MNQPFSALPPAPSDSLRAVLDSVFANPRYQWVEAPDPLAFLSRWWEALVGGITTLESRHPAGYWALVLLMLAVLAAVLVHAGSVMARTLRAARAPANPREATSRPIRDATWHRGEAARLAGAGRFAEAMQTDFLALALELETRQLLRFHPSKTPAEYAREAQLPDDERAEFRELVATLYRYAFAGVPSDAGVFADWQRRASVERYAPAR